MVIFRLPTPTRASPLYREDSPAFVVGNFAVGSETKWRSYIDFVIAQALARTFDSVTQILRELPAAITQAATNVAIKVANALAISPEIRLKFGLDRASPPAIFLTDSPFGKALFLFSKSKERNNTGDVGDGVGVEGSTTGELTVYYVDYGVGGQVELGGSASWTITDGLRRANISVNGNITASLSLGIAAKLQNSISLWLAKSSPGLVSNFSATIDLFNESNTKAANLVPRATPFFSAAAPFSATLALALPLSLGVGIKILPIKAEKTVALYEIPSFQATLNYTAGALDTAPSVSTSPSSTASSSVSSAASVPSPADTCQGGIGYNLQFMNVMNADLFGRYTYELNRHSENIIDGPEPYPEGFDGPIDGAELYPEDFDGPIDGPIDGAEPYPEDFDGPIDGPVDGPEPFDYVESIATSGTSSADDNLFQIANETAFASIDNTIQTASGSQQGPLAPDTEFLSIQDLSGNNELVGDPDGNIYYTTPGNGTLFASYSSFIEGDASGRWLHYYADSMATYNVSRLRLSEEACVPLSAEFVGLVPVIFDPQLPAIYVPTDTNGGVFFPVTCDIQDQESKSFLVTDTAEGIEKLKEESLRYTVTGGVVDECYFLAWEAPDGSADAALAAASSATAL
ncbi:MAG: hypothetical protein Q9205_000980 [Flavoplaca limonia]